MIRMYGRYRLTFPVMPGEITLMGHGNEIDTKFSITKTPFSRISAQQARGVRFEFLLPANKEAFYMDLEQYGGPEEWLKAIDRISDTEMILTIDEIGLAMPVVIGSVEGTYRNNGNFYGTIEFHRFNKIEFKLYSNAVQILDPPTILSKQQPVRSNPTGKVAAKKAVQSKSILDTALKNIQRDRIKRKVGQA